MKKFQLAWTGEQPLLKNDIQTERYIFHRDITGNVLSEQIMWSLKGYLECYFPVDDVESVVYEDGKKFLNPLFASKTISDAKEAAHQYWNVIKNIRLSFNPSLSNDELLKYFEEYRVVERKVLAYFMCSREEVMAPVEEQLAEIVKEKYRDDYLQPYITLTTPKEDDLLYQEKCDVLLLSKNPTDESIQEHALKYPLMLFNVESEAEGAKIIKYRLTPEELKKAKKEVENYKHGKVLLKKEQQEILTLLKSKEAEDITYFIQQSSLCRLTLKACWGGAHYFLMLFFSHLADKAGVTHREFVMFSRVEDVIRLLQSSVWLSGQELQNRKRAYLLHYKADGVSFVSGVEAEQKKIQILDSSQPSQELQEFKGTIAHKGKFQGTVVLVKVDTPSEIHKIAGKINKKHVLVTGMTNPNMTMLVNKVGAILTDEGGMACHAAIISREFKIPCLVGCKIATQILKDGDLVEVDAERGIVSILQR